MTILEDLLPTILRDLFPTTLTILRDLFPTTSGDILRGHPQTLLTDLLFPTTLRGPPQRSSSDTSRTSEPAAGIPPPGPA